ncbi:MAG TPA: 2-hydroxyacyl-CoA dehydratase family protein [Anaerolineae bacterium]|nr:2-hydroxyacyl-CoA dehydratase family protein [Anaerolineae bacterium]
MSERKLLRRPIEAAKQLGEVMRDYFYRMDRISKGDEEGKIAWCTSTGPAELLHAFGFEVHYPENHAAMLGSKRLAMDLIPRANAIGYSPDICSYLTSDVGAYLKGETPLSQVYPGIESVPRPDVLAYNTQQCRDVREWFEFYGREFNVPVVGINPPRGMHEVDSAQVSDVVQQIGELIPTLEEVSGQKFDIDRFKESMRLSRECSELWGHVLGLSRSVPAPWTFFDGCIHMGPAVCLRATQAPVDYYNLLKEELEGRVEDGVAAVENERFRIYWEGMPIWGRLRALSEQFSEQDTCVVVSTYCNSWIFSAFDEARPFESMAQAYTEIFINRSEPTKQAYIERLVDEYQVDGIIFHDAKTCASNSNSRYGMPQRLEEKLGIPTLVIDADLNDLRMYSEETTRTKIEAFVEQLEERN